jgi:hypothetical protein
MNYSRIREVLTSIAEELFSKHIVEISMNIPENKLYFVVRFTKITECKKIYILTRKHNSFLPF